MIQGGRVQLFTFIFIWTFLFQCSTCFLLPPNDFCSSAKYINFNVDGSPTTEIIVEGNNINSGDETGGINNYYATCGSEQISGDVWYKFNSGDYSVVTISTGFNGGKTNLDTIIFLLEYNEQCAFYNPSECIAYSDDSDTESNEPSLLYASIIYYQKIQKNTDYYIVVAGKYYSQPESNNDFGIFELSIKFEETPSNDNCLDASYIEFLSYSSVSVALLEGILKGGYDDLSGCQSGLFDGTDVWYTFDTYDYNYIIISSCYGGAYADSDFPIELSLLSASRDGPEDACDVVECVIYDATSCDVGGYSGEIRTYIEFETTYYIVAGSKSAQEPFYFGIYVELQLRLEANDDCHDATMLTSGAQVTGFATYWSLDGVAGNSVCTSTIITGSNVWYTFVTTPADKMVSLDFCSEGLSFPLTIYFVSPEIPATCTTAPCLSAMKIDCDMYPVFYMDVRPSETYYFSVGTDDVDEYFGDSFTFHFDLLPAIGENEICGETTDLIGSYVEESSEIDVYTAFDAGFGLLSCTETLVESPLLWFSVVTGSSTVFMEVTTTSATNLDTKLFLLPSFASAVGSTKSAFGQTKSARK